MPGREESPGRRSIPDPDPQCRACDGTGHVNVPIIVITPIECSHGMLYCGPYGHTPACYQVIMSSGGTQSLCYCLLYRGTGVVRVRHALQQRRLCQCVRSHQMAAQTPPRSVSNEGLETLPDA